MDIKNVDSILSAITRFKPSLDGFKGVLKAAADTGWNFLRRAGLELQKVVQSEPGRMAGVNRFGNSPLKLPERADIFGNSLVKAWNSKDPADKALAGDLLGRWLNQNIVSKGVKGRDFYV